ncbi:MAG: hypothetical protein HFE60_12315, partial [Anaerotignum sp.]|nr:hypothetical protein [Anaerotignum sp.]
MNFLKIQTIFRGLRAYRIVIFVNLLGTREASLLQYGIFRLEAGDAILLASGGHGFKVLEEVEMIEVKQGPYS